MSRNLLHHQHAHLKILTSLSKTDIRPSLPLNQPQQQHTCSTATLLSTRTRRTRSQRRKTTVSKLTILDDTPARRNMHLVQSTLLNHHSSDADQMLIHAGHTHPASNIHQRFSSLTSVSLVRAILRNLMLLHHTSALLRK